MHATKTLIMSRFRIKCFFSLWNRGLNEINTWAKHLSRELNRFDGFESCLGHLSRSKIQASCFCSNIAGYLSLHNIYVSPREIASHTIYRLPAYCVTNGQAHLFIGQCAVPFACTITTASSVYRHSFTKAFYRQRRSGSYVDSDIEIYRRIHN